MLRTTLLAATLLLAPVAAFASGGHRDGYVVDAEPHIAVSIGSGPLNLYYQRGYYPYVVAAPYYRAPVVVRAPYYPAHRVHHYPPARHHWHGDDRHYRNDDRHHGYGHGHRGRHDRDHGRDD
jgi:hypothetical protein